MYIHCQLNLHRKTPQAGYKKFNRVAHYEATSLTRPEANAGGGHLFKEPKRIL